MADEIKCDGEIARAARSRSSWRSHPSLGQDCAAQGWLEPGEQLLAWRSPAAVDRRVAGEQGQPPSGDLYVTSERLVLSGATPVSIALPEIQEAAMVGGHLALLLRDGVGVTISCNRPEALRTQIAEARASRRDAIAQTGD